VKLLLRTKRPVQLTAAGAAFLREAEQILHHSHEAAQLARRAARGEVGSLGIGFFGTASSPFLPLLVQNYRGKFPDVQLRLYELTPDQQLAAFDDGRIDPGFSRKFPPNRRAWLSRKSPAPPEIGGRLPSRASALRSGVAEGGTDPKASFRSDSDNEARAIMPISAFRFGHHTPNSVAKKVPNNLETDSPLLDYFGEEMTEARGSPRL
jgi:DNA-binding transcriptional LysR family regulator